MIEYRIDASEVDDEHAEVEVGAHRHDGLPALRAMLARLVADLAPAVMAEAARHGCLASVRVHTDDRGRPSYYDGCGLFTGDLTDPEVTDGVMVSATIPTARVEVWVGFIAETLDALDPLSDEPPPAGRGADRGGDDTSGPAVTVVSGDAFGAGGGGVH